ncbi:RagB/SusD family nutrient uptake outer membrane protein [Polaribacter marinivivus]
MKNINKKVFGSFFIIALIFTSCKESEFLEEINPNAITEATFWQSQKQFNAALTTVYGALQFQAISGGHLAYEFVRGDIAGTEPWYRPLAFRNLAYNDGTYYVTDKWNQLYIGIFRANQVIEKIQNADASIIFSGDSKKEIEAQARFLRAFFYFELVHNYGKAIIHTKVPGAGEFSKPTSTMVEVNEQVIIPDLEFARANLPQIWNGDDLGRVTWGAATSLLGKVKLFDKKWAEAESLFWDVIDSGVYSLTPDILDNFTDANEYNQESIFEVAYSSDLVPGVSGNAVDDTPSFSGAEATALATEVGQLSFGAFNTVLASYYLHEMLIYDEVDPNNNINNGNSQSKRLTATIAPRNGEGLYYEVPFMDKPGWGFGQSAYVKKHSNWYHLEAEPPNNRSGINFRHIRYADVLLMYAEAVLENSGDYMKAISYIDMVRSRAGVVKLSDYMANNGGMIPELHKSIQVHGPRTFTAVNSTSVMTHLRKVERAIELCFEGHRWKDLVRWGIVKEQFSQLASDEQWREMNKNTIFAQPPLLIYERIRPDFVVANQTYNSAQHDYFPIPTGEVETNNNIN